MEVTKGAGAYSFVGIVSEMAAVAQIPARNRSSLAALSRGNQGKVKRRRAIRGRAWSWAAPGPGRPGGLLCTRGRLAGPDQAGSVQSVSSFFCVCSLLF